MLSEEFGTLYSRLAIPYPLEKISESLRTIPIEKPGLVALLLLENN
jgi:hypothetical protein